MSCKINKGFIIETTGNKATIFDPETSSLYTLNGVGKFLFLLIKKGKAKEEIIVAMTERYTIQYDQAKKDIDEFIEELLKMGILAD